MIGILAYGSLISNPGWEIEQATAWRIPDVLTPFSVEYARSSRSRKGAPTLVPVQDDQGSPVQCIILVLRKEIREQTAYNILYRRELHKVGDSTKSYETGRGQSADTVIIEQLRNFHNLPLVIYTCLKPNLPEILDPQQSVQHKADRLAQLAIDSLTEETYWTCQDGIHYLAAAMHYGVKTKLTEAYCQALLQMSGAAPDLAEARLCIARQKGIIP